VVLISRTKEKLEQLAKEIQTKNDNIQVKTIPIDFTSKTNGKTYINDLNLFLQRTVVSMQRFVKKFVD